MTLALRKPAGCENLIEVMGGPLFLGFLSRGGKGGPWMYDSPAEAFDPTPLTANELRGIAQFLDELNGK